MEIKNVAAKLISCTKRETLKWSKLSFSTCKKLEQLASKTIDDFEEYQVNYENCFFIKYKNSFMFFLSIYCTNNSEIELSLIFAQPTLLSLPEIINPNFECQEQLNELNKLIIYNITRVQSFISDFLNDESIC